MTRGNPGNRFSTEVRARAVRMVLENEAEYRSRSQAVASIAEKFGCSSATLRDWVNKQAIEDGDRDGLTQSEREELKALQRENRELEQANEILRKASACLIQNPAPEVYGSHCPPRHLWRAVAAVGSQ